MLRCSWKVLDLFKIFFGLNGFHVNYLYMISIFKSCHDISILSTIFCLNLEIIYKNNIFLFLITVSNVKKERKFNVDYFRRNLWEQLPCRNHHSKVKIIFSFPYIYIDVSVYVDFLYSVMRFAYVCNKYKTTFNETKT